MLTTAQQDALAKGRSIGAPLGGRALIEKKPPDACPHCGLDMTGRSWHSYLGHLGLHGLADRRFAGDVEACQKHLQRNGLARQDPCPENGAMPRYQPLPGSTETQ